MTETIRFEADGAVMIVELHDAERIVVTSRGRATRESAAAFQRGATVALRGVRTPKFRLFVNCEWLAAHAPETRSMFVEWGLANRTRWGEGHILVPRAPLIRMAASAASLALSMAGLRFVSHDSSSSFEREMGRGKSHALGGA